MQNDDFSVVVNSEYRLFVEKNNYVYTTRFATTENKGQLDFNITAQSVANVEIFPKKLNIVPQITTEAGNHILFSIPASVLLEPIQLIVKSGGKDLIIIIDPPEVTPPKLADANVKSILDFGVDNTGITLTTTSIQSAINWMSTNNQGKTILYFPDGVYYTGSITVSSNMEVYLDDGAKILGSTNLADYPNYCLFMVQGNGTTSFKLSGRGIIDGNNFAIQVANNYVEQGRYIAALKVKDCGLAEVKDIYIRNNPNWGFEIIASNNATVTNVKIVSPSDYWNADGFDVNGSQNVSYNNCLAYTKDDSIAIMTRMPSNGELTSGITYNKMLCRSGASGVRMGWDSSQNISGVTFNNCEWVDTTLQLLAIHELTTSVYGTVRFNSCRFDAMTMQNYFVRSHDATFGGFGNGQVSMDSLEFVNCVAESMNTIQLTGSPSYKIKNVLFQNFAFTNPNINVYNELSSHLQQSNVGTITIN